MKKIAMFTMGTRGDVQPYIFLSKELIRNGFDVVLGSHPCWRWLVEEAGIHFEPIGPDIDIEKEAAEIRGKSSNQMLSMLKTMNFIMRIIQGFQKTIKDYELPDSMIACGSVPHSWLFKQGKCVIHHCGFGTTASAMIYGIPSIPVPHVLDQVGFAMQLEKCNVSTKMLKAKDLSEENIIRAINEMNSEYEEKKRNAEILAEKIRTEGGVDEAVRLIKEVLE